MLFSKFFKSLFAVVGCTAAAFALTACGGDDPEGPDTPDVPDTKPSYLELRLHTIDEGAEVVASETEVITLAYSKGVNIASNANVTLNGQKVTPVAGRADAYVDIPVKLEDGTQYELKVAEGAFVAKEDAKMVNPAYTLKFSTKEVIDNTLAQEVTKMIGFGWNLGNHFDSLDSNNAAGNYKITWNKNCPFWDGVHPTEELYKNLAAAGVKTVRMPVTWGPYENMEDGNYTIESDYMELVAKNVFWARDNGLNVILNTHHDEYWQNAFLAAGNADENTNIKNRIEKTWKQIAERFKDEGDYLILESFNELNHNWQGATAGELRIQNEWNQLAVDVIRATGAKNATRWIAVPSYQANPGQALKNDFVLPTDPAGKLIVAVHCYDPYNFTLANPLKDTITDGERDAFVKLLNNLKEKFIDKNIPCYLGEFGCSRHSSDAVNKLRDYYLEYFCRAAHFAGLAACLWDNYNPGGGSEHHAYFNHKDGSWEDGHEAIVKKMINALTSDDASYTLESIKK